jgi:homopolymeric O-antigen transport system permease protein
MASIIPLHATTPSASDQVIRIKPAKRFVVFDLRELVDYHELLYFLTLRDIKVRYKQTLLGAAWAVLQPFLAMVIFSVIFGHLAGITPDYDVQYPLFVYTGLLPWTYFASCLTMSSASVVGSAPLVTKVYFPRLLIPLASVGAPIVDFGLSFIVLLGLFAWYGIVPSWHVVFLPVFLFMALLVAFGVGLWLSALNVRYRDVPYAVPFLTQLWLYATPVIYPVSLIPAAWRWLLAVNPMTGVIEGFRWSLLGGGAPRFGVIGISILIGSALLLSGLAYFKHFERRFADVM